MVALSCTSGLSAEFCRGLLFIDKPSGPTCRSAVAEVLKQLGIHSKEKWGFVGTLDPLATGLLPIAVGSSTKAIPFVEARLADKTYRATWVIGKTRLGDDATGAPDFPQTERRSLSPRRLNILQNNLNPWGQLLPDLRVQRPPDFSAKHVRGRRAYQWAREGKEVLLPPSPLQVKSVKLLQGYVRWDVNELYCTWELHVSRGGYVRSLARDLGIDCGVGGYLSEIRRTQMGSVTEASLTWESLPGGMRVSFVGFDRLFDTLPTEDLQRVAGEIMGGKPLWIKSTQPIEFTGPFSFSTLQWQGCWYGVFLKALTHLPGQPYQVLKRFEMSSRITPVQLRGYTRHPVHWQGAGDQESTDECVARAKRSSV